MLNVIYFHIIGSKTWIFQHWWLIDNILRISLTRMHSRRMRTTCNSSRQGGMPGSDPPQFPPWVWAWTRSPSISPLDVGLDLIPFNFSLGCGPGAPPRIRPPGPGTPQEQPPQSRHPPRSRPPRAGTPPGSSSPDQAPPLWTEFLTHAYENITLLQTSFAGGKYCHTKKFGFRYHIKY